MTCWNRIHRSLRCHGHAAPAIARTFDGLSLNRAHGISVVLSGGAVVSVYADAEYVSYDLDFIPAGLARKVDAAMESLGFEMSQRHWTHPKSRYWVEFPPGPVAIGEETIHDFTERERPMGRLRLLAPTECVMDRLAWYFHDSDTQGLEQAVQVATRHPVDLEWQLG